MFVIQIGLPGVSAHFLQRHILAKARDLIVLRRGQGAPEPVLATLRAYVRCSEVKAQLLRFRLHRQLAPLIQRARAEERTVVLADEFLALCESVVFGGQELARRAADRYRELRSFGVTPRKTVDLLIGTWCIVNHALLLHCDRDFLPLVRHFGLAEA